MKKIITIIAVFFIFFPVDFSAQCLSKEAKIYLLTCSPGNELYSVFGHSAIRIKDSVNKMDIVFNYGTFDFNTDYFYIKYAQGLLPYQLTTTTFQHFMYAYVVENRSVVSQELRLDSINKQRLFDALLENRKPENRTYLYNFLYDNCSTRIRDIIEKYHTERVTWDGQDLHKSFWNLLDEYLIRMQWVKWGIHTILGQSGSMEASTNEYMFLPDYLMNALSTATAGEEPLAGPPVVVFEAATETIHNPWYASPFFVFTICTLLIIAAVCYYKAPRLLRGIAVVLFSITGLMGCLFLFLGYFTKHPITAPNLNLIWGNPLNLLVVPFLFRKQFPQFIKTYLACYSAVLLVGIPVWFIALPAVSLASVVLLVLMLFLSYRLRR